MEVALRVAAFPAVLLFAPALLGAARASAQEAAPPEAAAPESAPSLALSGSVDGFFAYNTNHPLDHASFFPGVGTSAKRENEASVNLAALDLSLPAKPLGFRLVLGAGTSTDVVHAAEVRGVAASPDLWRNVVQASAQWQTKLGRGLLLEAGIYPSHIGMEAFQSKDNWNYTRSYLGELSPYYQTGLKLAYPFSDHWSGQLHLLNGWQMISDNNRAKTVGGQLAYSADRLSFSVNGIAGPELPGDDDHVRALGDLVATWKATRSVSLGISADVAREGRPSADAVSWKGIGLYARLSPPESRTALALRTEYYDDPDGAISGLAQTLKEVTLTLEHRPVKQLILKLEGRYDRSSALAFAGDEAAADGSPLRKREQFLLLLGAVATF
jgi:hypothetical protein